MWVIDSEGNIVSKQSNNGGFKRISRKRKNNTKYYIGKISNCSFGVTNKFPAINSTETVLVSGKLDRKNKFGFFFNGKDLETGDQVVNKYLSNSNEIFCFYNENIIDPLFLNNVDELYCIVRLISIGNNGEKNIIYPEVVYPLSLDDINVNEYDLLIKEDNIDKYIPFFYKKPSIRWTK